MTTSANVFRPFVKAESAEIFKAFFNAEQSARAKHPVFAHFFQNEPRSRICEYRQTLRELQSENDRAEQEHRASAVNIMLEELCEVFMAHYDEHNLEHCLSELHQLGGCVISAVKMIEREIQNRKENMKRKKPKSPQRDTIAKKGLHIHTNNKAKRRRSKGM